MDQVNCTHYETLRLTFQEYESKVKEGGGSADIFLVWLFVRQFLSMLRRARFARAALPALACVAAAFSDVSNTEPSTAHYAKLPLLKPSWLKTSSRGPAYSVS
jgi:hypothetical protein